MRLKPEDIVTRFQNAAPDAAHSVKCDLAGEVLRSSGRLRLRVTGWSMLPTVMPGDTLIVERVSGEVSRGEIVLFSRNQRLFAHRVVSTPVDGPGLIITPPGVAPRGPTTAGRRGTGGRRRRRRPRSPPRGRPRRCGRGCGCLRAVGQSFPHRAQRKMFRAVPKARRSQSSRSGNCAALPFSRADCRRRTRNGRAGCRKTRILATILARDSVLKVRKRFALRFCFEGARLQAAP